MFLTGTSSMQTKEKVKMEKVMSYFKKWKKS